MNEQRSEIARQQVFQILVTTQDQGMSTDQSRQHVASQFQLSLGEILSIEREGILKQWPPLD